MPLTATQDTAADLRGSAELAKTSGRFRRWGPALWLALLSVVYLVPTCIHAARERLWYDEILTLDASSLLPSLGALWSFLKRGLELNPPLGFVLAAASESVFGRNAFGIRFPSVIAFWIMSACLYVFLKRRLPRPFAIAGMLLPALTAAGRYSYEARPYAVVLALAGVALVAWQAAAEGRRRRVALVAIPIALAAALCSQPLAVTLALPFLVGEAARSIQRKRLDVPMWCAFAAATPALWVLWKLKGAAGAAASAQSALNPLHLVGLTYFLLLMPAILPVAAAGFLLLMSRAEPRIPAKTDRGMPAYELAALIGFAAIPFVAVPISMLGGPYWPRYSLNAVIGLAGCLAVLLFRMAASRPRAGMAVAALFTMLFVGEQVLPANKRLDAGIESGAHTSGLQGVLEGMREDPVPIVVGRPLAFLELEHYASPALAGRLYYLTDPKAAARWVGNVVFDVKGPVLQELFPFRSHFAEYGPFVAQHKRFVVAEPGWVVPQLTADGATVRLKGTVDGSRYYEVTLK
ncbi:MAG: glycosyltransferase family 39 protein [Bryobacteraceae bacterium]